MPTAKRKPRTPSGPPARAVAARIGLPFAILRTGLLAIELADRRRMFLDPEAVAPPDLLAMLPLPKRVTKRKSRAKARELGVALIE